MKTDTLPVNKTAYLTAVSIGEEWTTGQVVHRSLTGTWTFSSSIGDGYMVSTTVESKYNTLTGSGQSTQKWVMTITSGPYGQGVIEGISVTKTSSIDGASGTYLAVGNGWLEDCDHLTYNARGSWEPIDLGGGTFTLYMHSESGRVTLFS